MEGPTPVSALIHAATMVTAGVYLIARMNPLYSYAPTIQHVIVAIGVAGLLMAGLTALTQTDIKRIIAFSTMSQIAYMFVGVGLGAYWTGIFHLTTHAFFKALLFMGAGVVIHALADEQDIRNMGGLQKWLPRTAICMWIGTLALAGVFPLSGGISKDAILASGLELGGFWGYARVRRRRRRRPADRPLRVAADVRRVPRRAERVRRRARAAPHRARRGPADDADPGLHPDSARRRRRAAADSRASRTSFQSWLEPIVYGGVPMLVPSDSNDWIATVVATSAGVIGILVASRIWGRRPPHHPGRRSRARSRSSRSAGSSGTSSTTTPSTCRPSGCR